MNAYQADAARLTAQNNIAAARVREQQALMDFESGLISETEMLAVMDALDAAADAYVREFGSRKDLHTL